MTNLELQAATMSKHTSPKQVITVIGKRLSITSILAKINRFSGTSMNWHFSELHRWQLRVSIISQALIAADVQPRHHQTSHKDRNHMELNFPFIKSRVWLQLHWQDISWKEKYDLITCKETLEVTARYDHLAGSLPQILSLSVLSCTTCNLTLHPPKAYPRLRLTDI
jgi:hypothetical protein